MGESKQLLADPSFKDALKNYDMDQVSPQQIKEVRAVLKKRLPEFLDKPDIMKCVSNCGHVLLKWVIAIVAYASVPEADGELDLCSDLEDDDEGGGDPDAEE